jgi:thymidine phosphorylase
MIFLAKLAASLDEARQIAESKLADGSAYAKFREVVEAQGGNVAAIDKFELLPNATGMREIITSRGGFISAIHAEDIGRASTLMGAGRERKGEGIDPAVGVILEVKTGDKVDSGAVLGRLYYTREEGLEEAAEMVEDAFRISQQKPEDRELILEVVG